MLSAVERRQCYAGGVPAVRWAISAGENNHLSHGAGGERGPRAVATRVTRTTRLQRTMKSQHTTCVSRLGEPHADGAGPGQSREAVRAPLRAHDQKSGGRAQRARRRRVGDQVEETEL